MELLLYLRLCFNGATSFQKWIAWVKDNKTLERAIGFNGATSFQKWIEKQGFI